MSARYEPRATVEVEASITLAWAWGSKSFSIPAEEVEVARRDPLAYIARQEGFSPADYIRYMEDCCTVRCAATTKTGRRCRREAAQIAPGAFQFRDLRAKAATDKAEREGPARAQDQLGHGSVTMTEHYIRNRLGKRVTPTK